MSGIRERRLRHAPELPPEESLPIAEFALPPHEDKPAAGDYSMVREHSFRREIKADNASAAAEKRRSSAKRSGIKYCLAAAAVTVTTVVTAVAPVAAENASPVFSYMNDYPAAYCAESAEECERMLEDELWYQLFNGMPENGYYAPLYESYEDKAAFCDALSVEDSLTYNDSEVLGFPWYPYTLETDDGLFEGKVYILPEDNTAVLRAINHGEAEYHYLQGEDIILDLPYDIIDDEPALRAFGNGTDIVGYWDKSDPAAGVQFHVTSEHTRDCGRNSVGIIVKVNNTWEW